MTSQLPIAVLLVLLSYTAIAQHRPWNIYDTPDHGIIGFLPLHISGDTLYGRIDTILTALPVNSIEHITIPRGHYAESLSVVGGLVGLGYGFYRVFSRDPDAAISLLIGDESGNHSGAELEVILCTAIGGAIGAILGRIIPRQDVFRFSGSTATVRIDIIQNLLMSKDN